MKKTIQIIATLVILLGSAAFAVQKHENTELVSPTPWEVSEYKTGPVKTYTSKKLGISFQYVAWDVKSGLPIEIHEKGDTIFADGDTITVFQKLTGQSLEEAIRETLLQKYPKCGIDVMQDPGYIQSYDQYMFLYAPSLVEEEYLDPADPKNYDYVSSTCPVEYLYVEGENYFIGNTKYPNRFLFVSLGEGVITPEIKIIDIEE